MKWLLLTLALWFCVAPAWAQNPTCPTRPPGDSTNACASTAFVQAAGGGGTTARTRLTTNADYYVRRDGSDSNTGTANTAGGAWLTIGKALVTLSQLLDLNGQNLIVHVQGANVGDGTYTENLLVPTYVGYNGNGFSQFIVQGENGVATINGATATATILAAIGGNASPIQFKNFVLGNSNASGIILEADDGGFIALNTITFSGTGAGGILAEVTQEAGRLLFMAGTHTMQTGLSTGTGFYGRSGAGLIFQPGVTINFAGATTFSNAVADFATAAYFDNASSTWSGTTPTGHSYVLDVNSQAWIVNASLIPGTLGATLTPTAVGNGGTGALTLTGALVGNGTSAFTSMPAMNGDCTISLTTGAIVCTTINGVNPLNAWAAFTPSPSCGTATITSASARSKTIGKTTTIQGDFTITALGTCAVTNVTFNLPNTAQSTGNLSGREIANSNVGINCLISASGTTGNCLKDGTTTWAVNDHLQFSGVYENQ